MGYQDESLELISQLHRGLKSRNKLTLGDPADGYRDENLNVQPRV